MCVKLVIRLLKKTKKFTHTNVKYYIRYGQRHPTKQFIYRRVKTNKKKINVIVTFVNKKKVSYLVSFTKTRHHTCNTQTEEQNNLCILHPSHSYFHHFFNLDQIHKIFTPHYTIGNQLFKSSFNFVPFLINVWWVFSVFKCLL